MAIRWLTPHPHKLLIPVSDYRSLSGMGRSVSNGENEEIGQLIYGGVDLSCLTRNGVKWPVFFAQSLTKRKLQAAR